VGPQPEEARALTVPVQKERERDGHLLGKPPDRFGIFTQVHSDQLKPLFAELPVQRDFCGSLPQALRSGRGEEAEEYHFSLKVLEADCPTVQAW